MINRTSSLRKPSVGSNNSTKANFFDEEDAGSRAHCGQLADQLRNVGKDEVEKKKARKNLRSLCDLTVHGMPPLSVLCRKKKPPSINCFGVYDRLQFDWLHNSLLSSLSGTNVRRGKTRTGLRGPQTLARCLEVTARENSETTGSSERHITRFTVDLTHTVGAFQFSFVSVYVAFFLSFFFVFLQCLTFV